MVCQFLLYNKVNQLYIYIYPHIALCLLPTLPIPPLQVVTKHRADLPVLCCCFPLAIYFTFGSIYKRQQKFIHSQFWRSEIHSVTRAMLSLNTLGEDLSLPFSFWWLLAILGIPWFIDASLQSLPPFLPCISSVSKFPSPIRIQVIGLRPTLIQYDFILT